MDHSSVVSLVAATVAHEMGHNFGMEHDGPDCECPEEKCVVVFHFNQFPISDPNVEMYYFNLALPFLRISLVYLLELFSDGNY